MLYCIVMNERIPPQDLEAEQSVLGAMMLSKDAFAAVCGKLKPEYFYKTAHQLIYEAILSLHDRLEPIDLVTLSAETKKKGVLDKLGGRSYLADVLNSVPTAANVEHYADIIFEKAMLRHMIATGTKLVQDAYEDQDDVHHLLDDAQKNLMELSKNSIDNELHSIGDVVSQVWDTINETHGSDDQVIGTPTGFKDLDAMTSGFQPADLVILAARPSMGKTALALNFAINAALHYQKKVAFFSLEMPKEQLAIRMLSSEARVPLDRLKTANLADQDYKGLSHALGRLSECPIYIDDTPSISPMVLRAKCRRAQMEHGLDLVVIDYLQLMRSSKKRVESRFQEVSEIVRDVKALGKELKVPIIALSQLSRDVEKRGGDVPRLSDLRESGEIEQTADLVMFIHREDYYESATQQTLSPTKLVIAKQRNGPTGDVQLLFRKDVSRFAMAEKTACVTK